MTVVGDALGDVREGLRVFLDIRRGPVAALAQLAAWGLQLLSVYLLAVALGLEQQIGIGGAAAVLFAVNVTAVVPVTPSNVGVFQFATASVLVSFGLDWNTGIAFGVILQAVEFATAVGLGLPALVREGMTWSDMRVRALSAAPVELPPLPETAGAGTRDGVAG
jgi:phosphatidylinositol alpha-mannosyltransferase